MVWGVHPKPCFASSGLTITHTGCNGLGSTPQTLLHRVARMVRHTRQNKVRGVDPKPCFPEWHHDGPHTLKQALGCLYTPNLAFDEWTMMAHSGYNGWGLHAKPCFDEWPDGPHTRCKVLYTHCL